MKYLHRLVAVASAAFFIAGSALAQNAGTVTNHAFALGKGAGTTGYSSLLCGSAQLAVGQAAADPICRTLTGDVTISAAGVTSIGATKVTSAMLNADVFSTAHTWAGQQTFVAPILGTPASGTLTNATGLPISTGVSGLGTGVATFLGTASSANLRGALTDETGTGSAVFANTPTLVAPILGAATATSLSMGSSLLADVVGGVRFISNDATAALVQYGSSVAGGGAVNFSTQGVERGRISASASDWTFGVGGATQGSLTLSGATSGGTKLTAKAAASGTLTLPSATDTLIGLTALRYYIAGLTLSTAGSSATFGVSAGVAVDASITSAMNLASAYTKTTSAWALGTGAGSLDTGAIANNTWYHVHLIQRPDTGVVDILTSLSASAPTMPTSYTSLRRIGSMKTNGSGQWTKFIQIGDEFLWDVAVNDVNASTTITTTNTAYTVSVPTGISVIARCHSIFSNSAADAAVLFSSPLTTTQVYGTPTANASGYAIVNKFVDADINVWTNSSAQINASSSSAASNTVYITTYGWRDPRGKDF